jgi:hypothetical protein
MRTFFTRLGIFAAVLAVLLAAGIAYVAVKGTRLDKEASAYSNDTVVAVATHWDKAALLTRASPNLIHAVSPDQLNALFDWFQTLGPLTSTPNCQGGALMTADATHGSAVTAKYVCPLQFAQGPATITLTLVKHDAAWALNGFNVSSPVLLAHKPAQRI